MTETTIDNGVNVAALLGAREALPISRGPVPMPMPKRHELTGVDPGFRA